MIETKIYVGLNDSQTLKQERETEKYISVLKGVCRSYRVPFSFVLEQGGYMHENGQYTQEQSLVISLIDVGAEIIQEIAKDLCVFFNQESVMITENPVNVYFISEGLLKKTDLDE